MREWIKNNSIIYLILHFILTVIIIGFLTKVYVDYRIDKKIDQI